MPVFGSVEIMHYLCSGKKGETIAGTGRTSPGLLFYNRQNMTNNEYEI